MTDSNSTPVAWGKPIPVDGKRPEWLLDDERIQWATSDANFVWWEKFSARGFTEAKGIHWDGIEYIRLTANHTHYNQSEPEPTDTVTVARMTVDEADHWIRNGPDGRTMSVFGALSRLGLIKPDPTPADRFHRSHPGHPPETVDAVLAWVEGEK